MSAEKVVFEVHPKAMRTREARTLLSHSLTFLNGKLREADPDAVPIRDPARDFASGVSLWMLLEALEGRTLGSYNESAYSDAGKMENLRTALEVMDSLGIVPVGDGLWNAHGLMEEDALHAWSVMTALALHYGCDTLQPGMFLPIAESHYTNAGDAEPAVRKTMKFVLVPEDHVATL